MSAMPPSLPQSTLFAIFAVAIVLFGISRLRLR
jgi:hypothetical protein